MKLPRGHYWVRFQRQSMRYHVDPAKLAEAQAAAAAGSTTSSTTTPAQEESALLADLKKYQQESPETILLKIKELRTEARDRRLEGQQAKAEAAEAHALLLEERQKREALEKQIAEAEHAKLVENEEYKKAYELSEQEKAQLVAAKDKSLIEIALKTKALELNIDPKLLPLLDRNGISVDSTGNVMGLELAFARMLENNKEIIEVLRAARAAGIPGNNNGDTGQPQPAEPPNPADKMMIPGTNVTYGDYRKALSVANGGATPPTTVPGATTAKKPDFKKMSRQEEAQWYKDWKARQAK